MSDTERLLAEALSAVDYHLQPSPEACAEALLAHLPAGLVITTEAGLGRVLPYSCDLNEFVAALREAAR
jgi:hypothetical protein